MVVNDRWGIGDICQHGGFYTCNDTFTSGSLLNHKWEYCIPLDKHSWGLRRNMNVDDVRSIEEIISIAVQTIRYNKSAYK